MINWKSAVLLAVVALGLGAAHPPVRGNWIDKVTVTESGAHILGNPNAPVKLAEYVSYTCSHCANFETQAEGPLRIGYVARGRTSVEVRHLVRDPIDMTVAMLTNCGPPLRFFRNHTVFLRRQSAWLGIAGNASEAQQSRWNNGQPEVRFRAIARDLGFYEIMRTRGYDRVAVDRCLADRAMLQRLGEMTRAASTAGVQGTPSFMIDNVLLEGVHDWQSLEAELRTRQ